MHERGPTPKINCFVLWDSAFLKTCALKGQPAVSAVCAVGSSAGWLVTALLVEVAAGQPVEDSGVEGSEVEYSEEAGRSHCIGLKLLSPVAVIACMHVDSLDVF